MIDTLRRQRIRQENVMSVLDCVIAQAFTLAAGAQTPSVREATLHMRRRAFELRSMANSVPKFVVEELVNESIARLEAARQEQARPRPPAP